MRFIPVGAGNSAKACLSAVLAAVYPRGCGELVSCLIRHSTLCGLSPWVRGTHGINILVTDTKRFIPVGAGNSPIRSCRLSGSAVYPRGCGELRYILRRNHTERGLSPWVRGTRMRDLRKRFPLRFIPVGAGNSLAPMPSCHSAAVYPRGCGELSSTGTSVLTIGGLSPWVRGTHNSAVTLGISQRFIPVGAGNSPETESIC